MVRRCRFAPKTVGKGMYFRKTKSKLCNVGMYGIFVFPVSGLL